MYSKAIIILISTFSMAACTSMRPLEMPETTLTDELEVNDHLVVYEKTGRIVDMKLAEIDGDMLHGTLTGSPRITVSVDVNDIERIDAEKIDGAKTTLAVVGTAIAIVPLAAAALLVGFAGGGY